MQYTPQHIQRTYVMLVLGNTLAASFIWGINTIFLLDAGLSNFEAFATNAFFTVGQVLFEIPTGVIADTYGRRVSYLWGTITLALSTALYLFMWQIQGPFWGWAVASLLLGLGFTFFSGALEAWLVDALEATGYTGKMESVFAQGQVVGGIAMLTGSVAGGMIAQYTNLGVPYILRSAVLLLNFATAWFLMKDLGFTPSGGKNPVQEISVTLSKSLEYGLKNPPVRWLMIAAPFTAGVGFYVFYALQPFLLELYGDSSAYGVAGLVAAIVASAQIIGGMTVSRLIQFFQRRTTLLYTGIVINGAILLAVSMTTSFWIALILIFVLGLLTAALMPVRQTYLNSQIPSKQRATVISFDSLMASSGGIVIQPVLGRVADVWSYPASYAAASLIQSIAIPFILLAKREQVAGDVVEREPQKPLRA